MTSGKIHKASFVYRFGGGSRLARYNDAVNVIQNSSPEDLNMASPNHPDIAREVNKEYDRITDDGSEWERAE